MYDFDAVIFDMDGLMLDSEPVHRAAWQQAARELGFVLSDDLYLTFVGVRAADNEATLSALWGAGFDTVEFRRRVLQHWRRRVEIEGIPHKPGLAPLLTHFQERGVSLAIATSTERTKALLSLGTLASAFAVLVTGDEVARGKPAPDIFLLAAERLGIAPAACLVLEDSDTGVQAALAAGMSVIQVPDLKPASGLAPVCQSLADVHERLIQRGTLAYGMGNRSG